jgi:hypothetical protein
MKTLSIPLLSQNDPNLPGIFHDRFDLTNYRLMLNGLKIARQSKIVIVGCIRDIDIKTLSRNIVKCIKLGEKFLDYQIILIENDSSFGFKNFINNIQHDKLKIYKYDYGYDKLGTGRDFRRVNIMASLRNKYVKVIENDFRTFEFSLVIDFDLNNWREDGVFNSLGHNKWDMIGANGIQIKKDESLTYYDTFAIIETNGHTYQPQEFKGVLSLNSGLHKVVACFGGIGLYKTKSLLAGNRYSIYKINDKCCSEQCGIHINMAKAGYDKIFINSNMIVIR